MVRAVSELPRAWWHGCWLNPGHYLFAPEGRSPRAGECPAKRDFWDAQWFDGGLAPRLLSPRAWLPEAFSIPVDRIVFTRMSGEDRDLRQRLEGRSEECPQGEFLLHAIAGCTVAAWWDRTQGDTRSACNSCLIVEGAHSANEMLALFLQLFPRQAKRLAAAGVALRFLRWAL